MTVLLAIHISYARKYTNIRRHYIIVMILYFMHCIYVMQKIQIVRNAILIRASI